MAVFAKQPAGPRLTLLSRHVVGRSRLVDLQMSDLTVSGEHAVLRWTGREWELHDLGSRNGTILDGRKLAPGERIAIARGAVIAFGDADNAWRLEDDAPPTVTAQRSDGEVVSARDDLLALPGEDAPEAVVFRDAAGDWVIEQGGETVRIADRRAVRAGGRDYVLRVPEMIAATWDNSSPAQHLSGLTFTFSVSRDEEHVALAARGARGVIDLGARAHHLVLLTLARIRLEDRRQRDASDNAAPRADSADGWIYQDELASKLAIDETHLNVAVFRCRRQLAEAGIIGAASVIERRRATRELRLGVAKLEIVTT